MSPSPEFLSPKLAKAPFDDPGADLILRSSDGVNFRVFKVILSLASSVFADMFTLPSPPASRSSSDEPSMVALPEDAETLDLALRHCYPIRSPVVAELRDARILLEFARKYQVDLFEPSLTRFLTDTIERDPVGVYALAAAYECWDIAGKALRLSLTLPVNLLQSPELRYSTMEQHQALFHYHILCGKAASAILYKDKHSHSPFNNVTRYGPRYLWSYLHRSALILAHHPNPDVVTAEAFVLKDMDCPHCATNKRREMLECSHAFAAEIKSAIEEVGGHLANSRWHC
ncbi:hypothetical protein EDB92DRAFT_1829942 [Lactarius akahatsu]|uniref:BTB domain-containing protein n=1 Tax=Lactarius akahatsu TaxID=416441 RepID=A0AAD4QF46_9AGAM|nr:hypothetical protein EDB92DRAFT_1829942 [Lactarius akahatsu]